MEGTDAKEIGSRILECRKRLRYSREKLAEAADVSNSFLAEVEHGTKNFSVWCWQGSAKPWAYPPTISCSAGKTRLTLPASFRCPPASNRSTCPIWRSCWLPTSRPYHLLKPVSCAEKHSFLYATEKDIPLFNYPGCLPFFRHLHLQIQPLDFPPQ